MPVPPIVARAWEAFAEDASVHPPLTLRGGCALDGYDLPPPHDAVTDEETDAYLEAFAFWGVTYLDGRSWRHYLPRLIDYVSRHPDDPAMVGEALVHSLRPPDRYPPRLASLTDEQEGVVRAFLELVLVGDALPHMQADASHALEEWWGQAPRSRPTAEAVEAARAVPVSRRSITRDRYRLLVPGTLTGSGVRVIAEESREVETFAGALCGDAHTVIAINVMPVRVRSIRTSVSPLAALFHGPASPHPAIVGGARRAERLDGLTCSGSPAELQRLAVVLAEAGDDLVTLTVRWWPRVDVDKEVDLILDSFEVSASR